jgi:23S rRNA (guanosine2251-2'-O)-methyltransferase
MKKENDFGQTGKNSHGKSPPGKRQKNVTDNKKSGSFRIRFQGQILYGRHAAEAAILNPVRQIHSIYISGHQSEALMHVLDKAKQKGILRPEPCITGHDTVESSVPGAVHQGIVLDAAPLPETSVSDLIASNAGKRKLIFAMLDQVTDPHNVGAILRSACVLGVNGLILQRRNAPEISGTVAKTASGAAEHVPVCYETNLSRTLETLKEAGFTVAGLDENAPADIAEVDNIGGRAVIVLGAEGKGMRRLVRENCDLLVRLRADGPISSLNVSNAAAIAFYAIGAMHSATQP